MIYILMLYKLNCNIINILLTGLIGFIISSLLYEQEKKSKDKVGGLVHLAAAHAAAHAVSHAAASHAVAHAAAYGTHMTSVHALPLVMHHVAGSAAIGSGSVSVHLLTLTLMNYLFMFLIPIIAVGGLYALFDYMGYIPKKFSFIRGSSENNFSFEEKLFKIYDEQVKGKEYVPLFMINALKENGIDIYYFTIGFSGNGEFEYNKLMEEKEGGHNMKNHLEVFKSEKGC